MNECQDILMMFTSNFGRAGSRKDTKDDAMAQGVCCQAGNNGFCQDTTPCADALRERRCTHVIIIVAIWVLGLVPMSLNWRAICGWRNDDQCYAAALGVGLRAGLAVAQLAELGARRGPARGHVINQGLDDVARGIEAYYFDRFSHRICSQLQEGNQTARAGARKLAELLVLRS